MQKIILQLLVLLFVITTGIVQAQQPVIKVDLTKETGHMDPVWAWFGYDEPNYTYMNDGFRPDYSINSFLETTFLLPVIFSR
jgi:xylan 1,4-beta-xylosidase